jgi:hypothetical protein
MTAPADYRHQVGALLRVVRRHHGMSLKAVDDASQGRWKAVVVGSYERGDRGITVEKLAELAAFYRVPVTAFLPSGRGPKVQPEDILALGAALEAAVDAYAGMKAVVDAAP